MKAKGGRGDELFFIPLPLQFHPRGRRDWMNVLPLMTHCQCNNSSLAVYSLFSLLANVSSWAISIMNAHKKLTDEPREGGMNGCYWKKLKRGTPIFSWFPLEMTSVRGQRAAIELKMKDKIQTKVQLKTFNLSLSCMVFENVSKSLNFIIL